MSEQGLFESYLDHETKYLNFYVVGLSSSGKTKIIAVMTKDNYLLGEIKFYGRWRGYQYYPTVKDQTILSIGCMGDICNYIKSLRNTKTKKVIDNG